MLLGFGLGIPAAKAQPVPPGSYLNSCRDAQVWGGRDLAAVCATRNGQWATSRLPDFRSCRGDISNQNGQLWCQRRPAPPPPPPPVVGPPGSYRQSCTNINFRNGTLSASCRTRSGNWRPSVLNTLTCQPGSDISNQDGSLFCPPQRGFAPPPGSYLRTCRDAMVGGAGNLRAVCRRNNGTWNAAVLNLAACRGARDIFNNNGNLGCF